MRTIVWACLVSCFAGNAFAESPDPPLSDKRLTIHTLVREDIFAGWRAGDMERFARGEKNIDKLLELRPNEKPALLAWKGGAKLFRAVLAHEAGDPEGFDRYFKQARELLAEAQKLAPLNPGVAAVVGGSYLTFGDRLPAEHRADAWSQSYDNYLILWKQQGGFIENMPVHIRGELMAGLVQSAQRTGRQEELERHLAKLYEVLAGTPYERAAKRWIADPEKTATGNISCKTCHTEGRLQDRLAAFEGK